MNSTYNREEPNIDDYLTSDEQTFLNNKLKRKGKASNISAFLIILSYAIILLTLYYLDVNDIIIVLSFYFLLGIFFLIEPFSKVIYARIFESEKDKVFENKKLEFLKEHNNFKFGELEFLIFKLNSLKQNHLFGRRININSDQYFQNFSSILDEANELKKSSFYLRKLKNQELKNLNNYYKSRIREPSTNNNINNRADKNSRSFPRAQKNLKNDKNKPNIQSADDILKSILSKFKKIETEDIKSSLGLAGELLYMKLEKERIENFGFNNSIYPIHVSKNHGDEFGFDIYSIDEYQQPLFIEIKTTSKNMDTAFYITRNELEMFNKYPNNYIIVRLHEFDGKSARISTINSINELKEKYNFETQVYKLLNKKTSTNK